jgi:putative peptidoglycan lipid II flippase
VSKIAKSSLIVTIFTVLGLGFSFLSSVVIAANFGAGRDMDVFLAATALPFFITAILSSSLNFTFIPVFAEYRAKAPSEIWKVVNSFINLNTAIAAAACALGIAFAVPLMKMIAPGFDADKLARSAELLRWLFPVIIFTVINELLASVYYSNQRFVIPSLNKIIGPALTISYVIAFHNSLSTKSIVLAMLTSSFIQAAVLIFGFAKSGEFCYSLTLDYKHPGVRKILRLMTPLVLGMLIYKAVPLFDAFFLSGLPNGSISHIGYAAKLTGAIFPVIASGISVSIFPAMSRYAAENDLDALKGVLSKGVRMIFFLAAPFLMILTLYGRPVVRLIFERGAFTPADTTAVYCAFAVYLLSLPASAAGTVVSQAFYAIQENRIIFLIGVLMMGLYAGLCFLFLKPLGYLAIPAAYAIYYNCAIFTTSFVIRKKIGGGWPPLAPFFLKSSAAAVLAAGAIYPLSRPAGSAIAGAGLCAAGFILYFIISKVFLSLDEADSIWRAFRDNFLNRLNLCSR